MNYVGTVILYNPNKEALINNISTYIPYLDKLYLIDNSENSNELLFSDLDSKAEYIWNGANVGIAKALNIAARKALEDGYNWLLTMDQDSQFKGDSMKVLEEYIDNYDGNIDSLAIVSPFHETVLSDGNKPINDIDKPIIVMTSGNIINLTAYKAINGFKDWYFIDCVDFDYCLNLIRHGYEIHQVNKSILLHELGNTVKRELFGKTYFCDNHNHIRRYYITRNRYYICDEYKNDFPDYCAAEARCTRSEIKRIILFEKHKLKKLWYMHKGYSDYKNGKRGRLND